MLIRIVIDNVFSFGERREFNTLPDKSLKTLEEHKYPTENFPVLKLSSIYGANGAGKSNLIKALYILQRLVLKEEIPYQMKDSSFKFTQEEEKLQTIAVEFIQDETAFIYAIEFKDDKIINEELYLSGLGKKEDALLYQRKTDQQSLLTDVQFSDEIEQDERMKVIKSVLLEEFIKADETILKLLSKREHSSLRLIKTAYYWFADTLEIILPSSRPRALAHLVDINKDFKSYANSMMSSFNIGICSLDTEKTELSEFVGKDNPNEYDDLMKRVESMDDKILGLRSQAGDELIVTKEDNKFYIKRLILEHRTKTDKTAKFDLAEESDGTVRLLEFIPAFRNLATNPTVYLIDEIERSIHPLMIKELIRKFSQDNDTRGQLIFSTHESNLLDQEIFRQDEIWFAEKNVNGATDLYSLSDFKKEHKTIDIRKGYLNGRYGSIPFLGNLKELNWQEHDINQ